MCNKKMFSMMMAAVMTVGVSAGTVSAEAEYEPVTITLNLQRSGLGENVEYTFTEKPSAVVASGEQMLYKRKLLEHKIRISRKRESSSASGTGTGSF